MNNVIEYKDITAFHPGYYIADIVEDMGISQSEFAMRLGTTGKTLSNLVNGQINISNDLAKKLSVMLGTSPEVWLNLQAAYDSKLVEIEKAEDFERQKAIARLLDYSYFVENAGLPNVRDYSKRVANLCGYFKIANLDILKAPDFLINYENVSAVLEPANVISDRAWLLTAMNYANEIATEPFNADKLKSLLPELGRMNKLNDKDYLSRIKNALSGCGIAFVMLPNLKNSRINGVVKWVNHDRAVLAMNSKLLDSDKFWVTLYSELKCVLQQKIKKVFISSDAKDIMNIDVTLESDASAFVSKHMHP